MNPLSSNLRLFPEPRSSAVEPRAANVTRILRAGLICDIIRDRMAPIFHWVVQDCETNEVLGLGQAHSFNEAHETAVWFLDDLRLRRAV
ncbi:MAG TPA: hypothetical protein VMZ25_11590 [Terriglobales bacterium]|nr:hypothetical protein [Terriglobales bacterium]